MELKTLNKTKGVDCQIASGGGRMQITMDRYEVRGLMFDREQLKTGNVMFAFSWTYSCRTADSVTRAWLALLMPSQCNTLSRGTAS